MTKQDFLTELGEIMQLEMPLFGQENLNDIVEWDSMARLGVMSMFDIEFGITLTANQLSVISTIPELISIAGDKNVE